MSTAPAFSPGPCTTRAPFGGQRLQMHARALVAAVLGPHDREDAELGEIRLAADELDDAVVLAWRDAVAFQRRGVNMACASDPRLVSVSTTDSNSSRPSRLPRAGSQARSGCGIRPTTLRAALQMPAMLSSAPFGLASARRLAVRIGVAKHDPAARLQFPQHVRRRVVVAFAVRDRHPEHLPWRAQRRERRIGAIDPHADELAVKLQVAIAQHRAGQQPAFEQDLEAIAHAEDRPALRRELGDGVHDGEKRAMAPVRR